VGLSPAAARQRPVPFHDGGAPGAIWQGNGLPDGNFREDRSVGFRADPNRVYASSKPEKGGLYRSDDGGDKWERTNDDERYRQRAWYFSHVFADPKERRHGLRSQHRHVPLHRRRQDVHAAAAPHGDHHGLWIDPTNPQRMINGDDGGATISIDGGKNWTPQMNQPTAQFYHVAPTTASRITCSARSRTTLPSGGELERFRADRHAGLVRSGRTGERFHGPDPRDGNIVYAAGQGVFRFDKHTEQGSISPWPIDFAGHGVGDFPHRFQWTEPILFSPHDPNVIYTAGEVVFKTTNQGKSWTIISPDLTRNDKSKQKASGGRSPRTTPAWNTLTPSSRWPNRRWKRVCCGPAATMD
jgi:hypothetical protein